MTRSDLRLVAVVLAASLLVMAPGAWTAVRGAPLGSADIVVSVHGSDDAPVRLSLSADGRFAVNGPLGPTVVEVSGGRVRIAESPCGEPAWHGGWLGRPGQRRACAPNRVILEIRGRAGPDGFDAEVGLSRGPGGAGADLPARP